MKALFGSQEPWEIISDGYTEATVEEEVKDRRKKDNKALFLLYQGLDEPTFERIVEATSSKQAWDTLNTLFKGIDRVKRVRLQTLRAKFDVADNKESEVFPIIFHGYL